MSLFNGATFLNHRADLTEPSFGNVASGIICSVSISGIGRIYLGNTFEPMDNKYCNYLMGYTRSERLFQFE